MRVLVTGASGFVGRALVPALAGRAGIVVRAASRLERDGDIGARSQGTDPLTRSYALAGAPPPAGSNVK